MVNTHSDEVQDLIESKLETKFKKVDFILTEEVEKNIAEAIPAETKQIFQKEIKENFNCSSILPIFQHHVKNLK